MAVFPQTRIEQLEFCEEHWPVWNVAPAAIGLTALQVTNLKTATEASRAAYNAAQTLRAASKAGTVTFYSNTAAMREQAGDLIRAVKSFAELQANPLAVYAAAHIDPPAEPQPAQAPGKATDISVTLQSTGAVTLSWSADNAAASSGAFYNIARKLPGQAGFFTLGGAPGTTSESRRMSFTDSSLPVSAAGDGAQYIIQGQRGTLIGSASDAIVVQFGVEGGGGFTLSGGENAGGTGISLAA